MPALHGVQTVSLVAATVAEKAPALHGVHEAPVKKLVDWYEPAGQSTHAVRPLEVVPL